MGGVIGEVRADERRAGKEIIRTETENRRRRLRDTEVVHRSAAALETAHLGHTRRAGVGSHPLDNGVIRRAALPVDHHQLEGFRIDGLLEERVKSR